MAKPAMKIRNEVGLDGMGRATISRGWGSSVWAESLPTYMASLALTTEFVLGRSRDTFALDRPADAHRSAGNRA